MPEGRRYSPDNPSPAMQDFAQYIRDHGYPEVTDRAVAATSMFHKEWQRQHAERVRGERKIINAEREKEREANAQKRADAKAERDAKKKADEEAKEKRRQEREDAKAAKEAADAESGDEGETTEDGESRQPRKRLRTRDEASEGETVGASAGSF